MFIRPTNAWIWFTKMKLCYIYIIIYKYLIFDIVNDTTCQGT
jgi:hypothetical protein